MKYEVRRMGFLMYGVFRNGYYQQGSIRICKSMAVRKAKQIMSGKDRETVWKYEAAE